jgi:hypothetical protein
MKFFSMVDAWRGIHKLFYLMGIMDSCGEMDTYIKNSL